MSEQNGYKPTLGAAWRKPREEGYVVELPSGNCARLRPVSLDVLIMQGQLPDLLTPIAAKMLWADTQTDAIADQLELAKGYTELVHYTVKASVLEPKIVDVPQADDEVSLEDIDFADKTAIFQLATQPSEVLRRFRRKQAGDVEPLSDGEGNEQPGE